MQYLAISLGNNSRQTKKNAKRQKHQETIGTEARKQKETFGPFLIGGVKHRKTYGRFLSSFVAWPLVNVTPLTVGNRGDTLSFFVLHWRMCNDAFPRNFFGCKNFPFPSAIILDRSALDDFFVLADIVSRKAA